MRRITVPAGDYIYKVEESSTSVFVVRSGKVELTTPYPETGEGIDEIIDQRVRTSNARAATDANLIEIEQDELMDILYTYPEKSLVLGKGTYERLKELFSEESLESDLARLREEMQLSIRQAVVAHESRVVKSHNGMAAIAVPIIFMVLLAMGAYWFFHRG
jgi:CRP-like cAMP-binding protein